MLFVINDVSRIIKAVLLDLDGTLIDSELLAKVAWQAIYQSLSDIRIYGQSRPHTRAFRVSSVEAAVMQATLDLVESRNREVSWTEEFVQKLHFICQRALSLAEEAYGEEPTICDSMPDDLVSMEVWLTFNGATPNQKRELGTEIFGNVDLYKTCARIRDSIMQEISQKFGFELKPGAIELLDVIEALKLPYAIVTASPEAEARTKLAVTPIADRFPTVFSGVGKTKMEMYRQAAIALGVDPSDALAVEDAPIGIICALEAECAGFVIPDLDLGPAFSKAFSEAPSMEARTLAGCFLGFVSSLEVVAEYLRSGLEGESGVHQS